MLRAIQAASARFACPAVVPRVEPVASNYGYWYPGRENDGAGPAAASSLRPTARLGSTSRTTEGRDTTQAKLTWATAARSARRRRSLQTTRSSVGSALAATGKKLRRASRLSRRTGGGGACTSC